ncbi:hypothetical protein SUGI_0815790 [Cryptomeria japonica]|nr:hypothetical protein SUGI_0815790 [Cryptomeria japonica]
MGIISDDYDLIDFFGVQGEAVIRPQGAMLNEMQSLSEEKEGRERKRSRFVDKYHLSGSCFISERGVVKSLMGKKQKDLQGCSLCVCSSTVHLPLQKNKSMAMNLLKKLWSRVSITGNSIERVAAYFTEALSAKFKQINSSFF